MFEARKRRDEIAVSTLGMLKTELVGAAKEPGAAGAVDEQTATRVLRREVKKREEAADAYRQAGRAESADRETREAEVRKVIEDVRPEGPGGFGQVMKEASRRLAGRAEGAEIAAVARRLLA